MRNIADAVPWKGVREATWQLAQSIKTRSRPANKDDDGRTLPEISDNFGELEGSNIATLFTHSNTNSACDFALRFCLLTLFYSSRDAVRSHFQSRATMLLRITSNSSCPGHLTMYTAGVHVLSSKFVVCGSCWTALRNAKLYVLEKIHELVIDRIRYVYFSQLNT